MNIAKQVTELCLRAFEQAYPALHADFDPKLIEVTEATQPQFGHFQCNAAMKMSKLLGENPRTIAGHLKEKLAEIDQTNTPALLAKTEVAGPGFLNLTLNPNFLNQIINAQLHDPHLGVFLPATPLKVVIDYSSPNTAKEMHVGHLRSTIIGDCLARIYRFLGHEVLALNHVGDWGTQFGMLIAHLKTELPAICDETPPNVALSDLAAWYKTSKKRFDEDPVFKKQAQEEVVALQKGDPVSYRAWQHICAISRQAYQHIYDLLDIKITERGESFYKEDLAGIVKDFEEKGLVTLSEGAKCVYLEGFTNREGEALPLMLQKADGGYNYTTTDLAALKQRITKEKANKILYVVDIGQSLHFQMLFAAAKRANFYDPQTVEVIHVPFGLVLGPDGKKFKTRSGETERLIDLIQNAIDKAKQALASRSPDMLAEELEQAARSLGINAIKYADLSCHRTQDYAFSYEKMLRFEGNTAAFLLYAYVRIQSIQRKTSSPVKDLIQQKVKIELIHPEEMALGLLVCQFNEVIDHTRQELCPHRLTDYLFRLAEKFHSFFHHCRVEGSPEQNSRLLLCETVAQVLKQGFHLLGLTPLERM